MANTPANNKEGLASEEDQVKLLEEAKNVVKAQGFHMKRCLDTNNLMDALKHASNMICELRTSLLSPRNYYALYIEAFDQLRDLESYLLEGKHGKRMAELYELVQYAGNILPRLYLLITVGSAYIKMKEAPARDVLRDLVEMCRGVQHPTRGLFLRTYLSEMVKDKLPDTGSEFEGKGGNVRDAMEFVLFNFTEMNKLWVRMQFQGSARDKEKRESERSELRLLVGKNIARLSQLEGVDIELYTKAVLPRLIDQIVSCKDVIAQQYLTECIIQCFPDDFHLKTLDSLLVACGQLVPGVNLKTILVSLIDRLTSFSTRGETIPADVKVFEIFSNNIRNIVDQRESMPLEDALALQSSLLSLCMTCYPTQLDYVDQIFKFCSDILDKKKEEKSKPAAVKQILALLSSPLESYQNIITVLKLENYGKMLPYLSLENRKRVAIDVTKTCLDFPVAVPTVEYANQLLGLLTPLVKDEADQPEPADDEDFQFEQNLVAGLTHLFEANIDDLFAIYVFVRKQFGQGGPKRIRHTLPPLVFRALKLALRMKDSEDEWTNKAIKVFKFAHETVTALSRTNLPELSLKLFLQCAEAADHCGPAFETIAYEFFTQAFLIYEEQISDSQAQFNALTLIIGTLQQIAVFGEENYDTLITKSALHASKLLKKPDQCRAVYLCAHLFWSNLPNKEYKNGKRVLECLQKSLKIADNCMDSSMNVHLFVEILNRYLYYFENGCEVVTVQYLSGLIELINTNIANMDSADTGAITNHYKNSLEYIRLKKQSDARYKDIEI